MTVANVSFRLQRGNCISELLTRFLYEFSSSKTILAFEQAQKREFHTLSGIYEMFNSIRSRLVKRSMVAKELLLFFLFCGAGFTSAILEEREQSSQCRKQTVFCPCKDRRGMTGHILVVTCSDQNDPNNPLCQGETLISEDCGKGELLC